MPYKDKAAQAAYAKAYRIKHAEKYRENDRIRYPKRKDQLDAATLRRRERDPESFLAASRVYTQEYRRRMSQDEKEAVKSRNAEHQREKRKTLTRNDRATESQKKKTYYAKNPDKWKQYHKDKQARLKAAMSEEGRERIRARDRKSQAKRRQNLSPEQWSIIKENNRRWIELNPQRVKELKKK